MYSFHIFIRNRFSEKNRCHLINGYLIDKVIQLMNSSIICITSSNIKKLTKKHARSHLTETSTWLLTTPPPATRQKTHTLGAENHMTRHICNCDFKKDWATQKSLAPSFPIIVVQFNPTVIVFCRFPFTNPPLGHWAVIWQAAVNIRTNSHPLSK